MKTLREKFWQSVVAGNRMECWLWRGALFSNRYGHIVHQRKNLLAHRVAWQLLRGEIPKGKYVLHRCDVTGCVNPDHLFLGTQRDNMRDCLTKGRHRHGLGNPKLDDEKLHRVYELRNLGRTHREIARTLKVSQRTIATVLAGRSWGWFERPNVDNVMRHQGTHNGNAKLTDRDVREIRRYAAEGWSGKRLAERYGVHPVYVSAIVHRRSWAYVT